MISLKWVARALRAERRAELAEDVAKRAMSKLSDDQLSDLRDELSGGDTARGEDDEDADRGRGAG